MAATVNGRFENLQGVETWVAECGEATGDPLLLLHGGLSDCELLLDLLAPVLATTFRVISFDRTGHGRTAKAAEPFSYQQMVHQTISVIEQLIGTPVPLVGWSDGGVTALEVALQRPDLVSRLVLIGTNFHRDGYLNVEVEQPSELSALFEKRYVERSANGTADFAFEIAQSAKLWATEPNLTTDELSGLAVPTLVMVGDDDSISLDHTRALYDSLPNAQLAVVPGASHALPLEKPNLVAAMVMDFLTGDAAPKTMLPLRRR